MSKLSCKSCGSEQVIDTTDQSTDYSFHSREIECLFCGHTNYIKKPIRQLIHDRTSKHNPRQNGFYYQ